MSETRDGKGTSKRGCRQKENERDETMYMEKKWYQWFDPEDSAEERKLLVKLDGLIVVYAFVIWWIKFVDQSNLNNAYVSGMKEDLKLRGNALSHFQAMYTLGSVLCQIPFAWVFVRFPMNDVAPCLDIGWGLFTLLQYRTESYAEMMFYRFGIGVFEAALLPGIHFVLGSWYRPDEIGRRGGLFYLGLCLGQLTSGVIASASFRGLDGRLGLAGWRWMFIVDAAITIPIGVVGFIVWPGTPARWRSIFLSKEEVALARLRLKRDGVATQRTVIDLGTFKSLAHKWVPYVVIPLGLCYYNAAVAVNSGGYILWLKSLDRYGVAKVNDLSTTAPALGIVYTLLVCFGSDAFKSKFGAIVFAESINAVVCLLLTVRRLPEGARWAAYNLSFFALAPSAVLLGWINELLKGDPAERALMLAILSCIGQGSTAVVLLLFFPTVQAPSFPRGYPLSLACAIGCILIAGLVRILHKRDALLCASISASISASASASATGTVAREM